MLLSEAGRAFLIVASLLRFQLFFAYQFHNNQKSQWGKIMSCLVDTTDLTKRFTAITKLLWESLNLFNKNTQSYHVYLRKQMAWLQEINYILYNGIEAN